MRAGAQKARDSRSARPGLEGSVAGARAFPQRLPGGPTTRGGALLARGPGRKDWAGAGVREVLPPAAALPPPPPADPGPRGSAACLPGKRLISGVLESEPTGRKDRHP